MKIKTEFKLKLYLKKRLPITVILDDYTIIDNLIKSLNGIDYVVKFGDIVFLREDFKFMTIKKEK